MATSDVTIARFYDVGSFAREEDKCGRREQTNQLLLLKECKNVADTTLRFLIGCLWYKSLRKW